MVCHILNSSLESCIISRIRKNCIPLTVKAELDLPTGLSLGKKKKAICSLPDDFDTELVVLPAVMGQNLPRETYWHMRGMRRLGFSRADVEMACDCVHRVAQFCETTLDRIPAVQTVEEELY